MKFIARGLLGIPMAAAAIAVGIIISTLLSSIARNPSKADEMTNKAILGIGIAEVALILAFILIMMIMYGGE